VPPNTLALRGNCDHSPAVSLADKRARGNTACHADVQLWAAVSKGATAYLAVVLVLGPNRSPKWR